MSSADFEIAFADGGKTRVFIGPLAELPALCGEVGLKGTPGLICDSRLLDLHRPALRELESLGPPIARTVLETKKSLAEVDTMCEALAARGVGRDGFVVALGGGVLTDLAGLAAALYLRGVPWVSAPTTLLAQVDAGLGGKTGANLRAGKNLVGAFHQPRLVVCDPALLATLPVRERWSGLAEIVKCALIAPAQDAGGEPFLDRCERDLEKAASGDLDALAPLIEASVRIKARIVAADEREGGQRAFLNFGHTVGHALEAATQYARFTHGEAVALGLRGALFLSHARGLLPPQDAARALALVLRLRVEPDRRLESDQLTATMEAMARDKKALAGQVRFVLLEGLGKPKLHQVEPALCAQAIAASLS